MMNVIYYIMKAIACREDIWEKIIILRIKLRLNRMDDVIDKLLGFYEEGHKDEI